MPVYDFYCEKCGVVREVFANMDDPAPDCCGGVMTRRFTVDSLRIKTGYPGFVDRIDEIHKRQADKGERLRLPHPREVMAT